MLRDAAARRIVRPCTRAFGPSNVNSSQPPANRAGRLAAAIGRPWIRRSAAAALALFVLFGLFGYLALPGIIKSQVEKAVTSALNRRFTIDRVQVRPYALAVTVHGAKLYEADGQGVFASFEQLQLRASASSLIHLAPVLKEVHLTGPFAHLVRTGPNRYSTDDIVAALSARKPSPAGAAAPDAGHPARFSVYNIRIDGGRFEFDDRPTHTQHVVANLQLGIPFVSSLPSQQEVFVEPHLSARIDGAALSISSRARPFAATEDAVVDLDLNQVDVPKYLEYLPFEPRFRMRGARLDLHLEASFQQPKDRAAAVIVAGKATLKSLQLDALDGQPILVLPELVVELTRGDPFGGQIQVARVAATGLELNVDKDARGGLNLEMLAPPAPSAPESAPVAAAAAEPAPGGPALRVAIGQIALKDAALRYVDHESSLPLNVSIEQFDLGVGDTALDPQAQRLAIGRINSGSARFRVLQGAAGPATAAGATARANRATREAVVSARRGAAKAWAVSVGQLSIGDWTARIESRGLPQAAVTTLSAVTLTAGNLSTAAGSEAGKMELKAQVNRKGSISIAGALGLVPARADLALDLKGVDLLASQPYFTDRINLLITQAELSSRGRLVLDQAGDGSFMGGFRGDATLGNLATIDKLNGSEFLNWKSLSFGGVNARLAPFALDIDRIALNDFYARVIIDPSGRINLQDIVASGQGEQRSLTTEQPDRAQAGSARGQKPAAAPASAPPAPMHIGQIALQGGRVRYTDNFIRPNYTADLLDLGGTISGLSSAADTAAAVDLHGEVNAALLNIAGQINPIKGDLFLDLKAGVHGMELAPLSPYSGKYVGYGIERGKLSFDVAYKLDHRQLTAENRLVLDQLTFGDKMDSPTATTLPVQLAVALLKDRNGVIDVNLPVGGSLDDPQFSVGGVIVKVLVNLVTKAVTAPFALLGSLFGGGDELSYIEYAPGRVESSEAGSSRLRALAAALKERPGLKLEIAAWVDPDGDREGLKRENLDRRVRAMKVKALVAKGESATVATVVVSPEEYPALLAGVYEAEKPAQTGGAAEARKAPAPQDMEKLLLAGTAIPDEELSALGDRRSQAVKQWLQTTGEVPEQRLFLLATKVGAGAGPDRGAQTAAKAGRVDFSLK